MANSQARFMDNTLSVEQRTAHLLEDMTLDEKLAQLGSCWVYQLLEKLTFSTEKAGRLIANGIGHITRLGGASNVKPKESAQLANTIQKYLIENTRLAIPAIIHEECCSGYMARGATVFPQAIGIASAWETELVEIMCDVIRAQIRSVGGHHALSPVLDVARDPRWGRTEETFGEDPYLVTQMGVAYVRGLQGKNWQERVIATGKHFVGYSVSEGGMNWAPPHIMPRELREVYLLPFEAAVREAGMASIMNGYHEIDGVPCGASKELLNDILRDEWGFDGTVVSDYFSVSQLFEYHHVACDKADAAHIALNSGLDVELPATDSFGAPLKGAVESGQIPMALVDQAVTRILRQKFALGLFENPYVDPEIVAFDTPKDRQLAREIAQKSIVLLKNEGNLLPLDKNLQSLAVIGPNADSIRNLFGDYAYPAHMETLIEARRSAGGFFNTPMPDDIQNIDDFVESQSILTALRAAVSPQTEIHYARGCDVRDDSTDGFAEAVEAARKAQVAVVVVGDKAGLTDDCTSGEARDRAVLDLPGVQEQLVKAIYDTGTPVVLVLVNGRPVTLNWIAEQVPAILECWFPSEEGANAVVDVLFGDVNPGGKLPISFPRAVGQLPVFYSHRPSGGRSHWKTDYVETSVKPLYPFGYGLSYTTFAFSNLRVSATEARAGETVSVQVDVTNTGARAGDEVVQLYTHQHAHLITRPLKELKGFKRVHLAPGQTRTVTFELPVNIQAYLDRDMQLVVSPGQVELMVGSSAVDIHLTGSFEIVGETTSVQRVFTTQAAVSG